MSAAQKGEKRKAISVAVTDAKKKDEAQAAAAAASASPHARAAGGGDGAQGGARAAAAAEGGAARGGRDRAGDEQRRRAGRDRAGRPRTGPRRPRQPPRRRRASPRRCRRRARSARARRWAKGRARARRAARPATHPAPRSRPSRCRSRGPISSTPSPRKTEGIEGKLKLQAHDRRRRFGLRRRGAGQRRAGAGRGGGRGRPAMAVQAGDGLRQGRSPAGTYILQKRLRADGLGRAVTSEMTKHLAAAAALSAGGCGLCSPGAVGRRARLRSRQARGEITKPPKLVKFVPAVYPKDKHDAGDHRVGAAVDRDRRRRPGRRRRGGEVGGRGLRRRRRWPRSQQFVFEPAEIDHQPAPVKITYRYDFTIVTEIVAAGPQINFDGVVLERFKKQPMPRRQGHASRTWTSPPRPTRTAPSPSPTSRSARTGSSSPTRS